MRLEREAERDDDPDGPRTPLLRASDVALAEELARGRGLATLLADRTAPTTFRVRAGDRGRLKQAPRRGGARAREPARRASSKPLAANVAREVDGWPAGVRRARVRTATLLECQD